MERTSRITSGSQSELSEQEPIAEETRGGLLRLGAIAVGSAILGGIAAAWWYRKTVKKLHESGESDNNPHFGIEDGHLCGEEPEEL